MTKTLNNGIIYMISTVLMGSEREPGLMSKKDLLSVMAVRQALKFNCAAISEKYKLISEMIGDINKELIEEYREDEKVDIVDETYIVKKEFEKEFLDEQQEKLNELSIQPIDIDLVTYPRDKFNAYAEMNDGKLTEAELDILEMFVEEESDKTE